MVIQMFSSWPQNEAESTPNHDHVSKQVLAAQHRSVKHDSNHNPQVPLVLVYVVFSQTSDGIVLSCGVGVRDTLCEGCDIVQSDHAPQAGVAQGIFHGHLIRRRDGHQVELEEELEEEVERRVRRDNSRHKTQVRMHG